MGAHHVDVLARGFGAAEGADDFGPGPIGANLVHEIVDFLEVV